MTTDNHSHPAPSENIPLKELVSLTDDEIKKRNPDEASKYIKLRDVLLITEAQQSAPQQTVQITKPTKPKRKCTEKQLAALAAGRAKNPRLNKSKENK